MRDVSAEKLLLEIDGVGKGREGGGNFIKITNLASLPASMSKEETDHHHRYP